MVKGLLTSQRLLLLYLMNFFKLNAKVLHVKMRTWYKLQLFFPQPAAFLTSATASQQTHTVGQRGDGILTRNISTVWGMEGCG